MKKVAIFQNTHSLQIHTINLATFLAKNGFLVDLFLFNCNKRKPDDDVVEETAQKGLTYYNYNDKRAFVLLYKLTNKITKYLKLNKFKYSLFYKNSIFLPVFLDSISISKKKKYNCVIGVEKNGLAWAGGIFDKLNNNLIYYSLEIVDELMLKENVTPDFIYFRQLEIKYAQKTAGTIIQDDLRLRVLNRINNVNDNTKSSLFIPVSLNEDSIKTKSTYLHAKLNIDKSKKIILYFGNILPDRLALDLIRSFGKLNDSFVLVLHGYADPAYKEIILKEIPADKVYISSNYIPENQIFEIISSAYIGLSFYMNNHENDILTAFSSEKVARYCQCGIPFLAFNNISYRKLFDEIPCGETIDKYDNIIEVVSRIDSNYQVYRDNAWKAYNKYFYFCSYRSAILDMFNTL